MLSTSHQKHDASAASSLHYIEKHYWLDNVSMIDTFIDDVANDDTHYGKFPRHHRHTNSLSFNTNENTVSEANEICESIERRDAELRESTSEASSQFYQIITTAAVLFSQSQTRFLTHIIDTHFFELVILYFVLAMLGLFAEICIRRMWFSNKTSSSPSRLTDRYRYPNLLTLFGLSKHPRDIHPSSYAYVERYAGSQCYETAGYLFYKVVLALIRIFHTYSLFVFMALIRDRIELDFADEAISFIQIIHLGIALSFYFLILQAVESFATHN
jgi:hypothetical protein